MKSLESYYIGVDISKDKLDVFTRHNSQVSTVANRSKSIDKLIAELAVQPQKIHLVCEATGGYEKALLKAAFKAGCAISLVNARCVRSFADAMSQHAKTDPIDAETITHFAEVKRPSAMEEPSKTQEALQALGRWRSSLVTKLTQYKNALQKEDNTIVKRDMKSIIRGLERRIAKVEREIDKIVEADEKLASQRQRIESIKGVGRVSSNVILSELPELGSLTDKQASALVGVAPFPKDSGKHRGKRLTRGGRGRVRRGLYMGALSASRHNEVLSEFYQRLTQKRGKSHHVAVVAVMRKMVCLLNKMLRDPEFKPSEG